MPVAPLLMLIATGTIPPLPAEIAQQNCSMVTRESGPPIAVDRIARVFFATDSRAIDREGAAMLDAFAQAYDAPAKCTVVVEGYSDRSGSERHNLVIAKQRAEAVARYLKRKGLVARLYVRGLGERDLLVQTPDRTAQAENRNVVVYVP
jgi:outer membrane protein OmpA-like peptidoglycan-associated protein